MPVLNFISFTEIERDEGIGPEKVKEDNNSENDNNNSRSTTRKMTAFLDENEIG